MFEQDYPLSLASAASLVLDGSKAKFFEVTPLQAIAFTAINVGSGGELWLVVTTSGNSSFNLTFGSGFGANTPTLATGTTSGVVKVKRFGAWKGTLVDLGPGRGLVV